jgi:tRNA(fMet)-specific endonuclease VapC
LDTNIIVAYLNGNLAVAQRIADHFPEIAVPSLVAAELYYGAYASSKSQENLAKLDRFLKTILVVNFDLSASRHFGILKADLRKRGRPTSETDAWIAAIALTHNATLVTHNTRDFEYIVGLELEDWLSSTP